MLVPDSHEGSDRSFWFSQFKITIYVYAQHYYLGACIPSCFCSYTSVLYSKTRSHSTCLLFCDLRKKVFFLAKMAYILRSRMPMNICSIWQCKTPIRIWENVIKFHKNSCSWERKRIWNTFSGIANIAVE